VTLRVKLMCSKDLEATGDRPPSEVTESPRSICSSQLRSGALRAPSRSPADPSISFFQPLRRYFYVQQEKGGGCTSSCPKRR